MQMLFEVHGFILALHHDARFMRNPGALDRARKGFERLVQYFATPAGLACSPNLLFTSPGALR